MWALLVLAFSSHQQIFSKKLFRFLGNGIQNGETPYLYTPGYDVDLSEHVNEDYLSEQNYIDLNENEQDVFLFDNEDTNLNLNTRPIQTRFNLTKGMENKIQEKLKLNPKFMNETIKEIVKCLDPCLTQRHPLSNTRFFVCLSNRNVTDKEINIFDLEKYSNEIEAGNYIYTSIYNTFSQKRPIMIIIANNHINPENIAPFVYDAIKNDASSLPDIFCYDHYQKIYKRLGVKKYLSLFDFMKIEERNYIYCSQMNFLLIDKINREKINKPLTLKEWLANNKKMKDEGIDNL